MVKRKATTKQLAALRKGRAKRKANLKKSSTRKSKAKIKVTKKVTKVVKRRRKATRKNTSKGMFSGVSGIAGAIAYGAVREKLSTAISNSAIGQKLPATEFTDEAALLGANLIARKLGLGKNKIGNSILRAQKTVELARIGQTAADVMGKGATQTSNNEGVNRVLTN